MDSAMSYFYGLMQTDGTLYEQTRNRGRMSLEIKDVDCDIFESLNELIPCASYITSRKRKTNFGEITTVKLSIYDLEFRNMIKSFGFECGKKSDIIKPPLSEYSEPDYVRGLFDGDGSLGITKNNIPFISFITVSENMKEYLLQFIERTIGVKKISSRNKRDGAYNISLFSEYAQKLVSILYYDNCLSMKRKYSESNKIRQWIRPATKKRVENVKVWTNEEDLFILSHTISESMEKLNRSKKSVQMRIWRLRSRT